MDTFAKRCLEERESQSWVPEICMLNSNGIIADFVPFMSPSHSQQIKYLALGYPDNASFHFAGYSGLVDKDRIVEDIKKQAFIGGSRIRASERNKRKIKDRVCTVDFFCIRHKHNKYTSQTYNESCIQAVGTIIQKEHQTKSIKGKALNVRVTHEEDPNESTTVHKSKRRKTSSMRPLNKVECCPFGFTIFCSEKDNWWYLGFSARYVMCCLNNVKYLYVATTILIS